LGDYPRAIDFQQQSLAIKREIGDRNGEAASLCNLGTAYHSLGDYPRAIDFHQQSLAIQREIGDRNGEANSLIGLGNAYKSLGDYPRAIDFQQQSLAIKREIGDRNGEALSLWNLSNIYQQQGKIRKAREHKILALRIWRSLNLPIDAVPLPELSKRMFRAFEQQGAGWAESMLQSLEQLGWLMDILAGIGVLISFPVRLIQRFKSAVVFWFAVGLAITLLIWWLKR
jgi:tetratricopeptide (TPR) repeat protein